jgi:hypothetical protein
VFVSAPAVSVALEQMLHTAHEQRFAIYAYCFMPDHLHVLFHGEAAHSDFKALMTLFRGRAAYVYARVFRGRLWQVGTTSAYYGTVNRLYAQSGTSRRTPSARAWWRTPWSIRIPVSRTNLPVAWICSFGCRDPTRPD